MWRRLQPWRPALKRCACGCGEPVDGQKRYVSSAHRVKAHRDRKFVGSLESAATLVADIHERRVVAVFPEPDPPSREIVECFALDRERFEQMGYTGRHRKRTPIPRIDRIDAMDADGVGSP